MVTCQIRDNSDCMTFYSPVLSSVEPVLSEWSKENRNFIVGGHTHERTVGFNNRLQRLRNVCHWFDALFKVCGGM